MNLYYYDYETHIYKGEDSAPLPLDQLPEDFPATTKKPPEPVPYCDVVFDIEAGDWKQQMRPVSECFSEIEVVIDRFIYETVHKKGYDGIDSLPKYLFSSNPEFKADAEDALDWVTAVWNTVNDLKNKFISGEIEIMTPAEVIAALPPLEWRYPPRG